ncbi:MAG: hypothetical protein KBT03_09760 [Bacteroidales bacterium]|nr:hypothetical protein [Candidatus Scybalousia scybalohippi]
MVYEPQKRAEKRYKEKLKAKGINQHILWLDAQQWEVIRTFTQCIKKIKNLKYITGFDVSRDYLTYKIILDTNILNGGVLTKEEEDALYNQI